jgi:hypothetical protein
MFDNPIISDWRLHSTRAIRPPDQGHQQLQQKNVLPDKDTQKRGNDDIIFKPKIDGNPEKYAKASKKLQF